MEFTFKSGLNPLGGITFERKGNLRETLHIGKIGNPIRITGMYHPNKETLDEIEKEPRMETEAQLHILSSRLEIKSIKKVLEGIESGEITGDWGERYYISYWDESSTKKLSSAIQTLELQFGLIGEFHEEYIEFDGHKYLIP